MKSKGKVKKKVLLVDDHKITREGLRSLLQNQSDIEIVGEAGDGNTAVRLARKLAPDVVVMDISMPDLNGIDATRMILSEMPTIKVIALSMYSDRRFVVGMLKAGVSGYLLKDCAFEELSKAIKSVLKGKTYMSQQISDTVMRDYAKHLARTDESESSVLTDREREVLQLIAEGMTTKQIAARLYVSVKTIETHRRQVMEKLNIHSIAELTKFALKEGLTTL